MPFRPRTLYCGSLQGPHCPKTLFRTISVLTQHMKVFVKIPCGPEGKGSGENDKPAFPPKCCWTWAQTGNDPQGLLQDTETRKLRAKTPRFRLTEATLNC